MGSLMLASGKKDEAAKYFQLAVKFDSENLEAKINYGMTLVDLGRWNEAIAHLAPVARLSAPALSGPNISMLARLPLAAITRKPSIN